MPDITDRLVVAVERHLVSPPVMAPAVDCGCSGKKLFPHNVFFAIAEGPACL